MLLGGTDELAPGDAVVIDEIAIRRIAAADAVKKNCTITVVLADEKPQRICREARTSSSPPRIRAHDEEGQIKEKRGDVVVWLPFVQADERRDTASPATSTTTRRWVATKSPCAAMASEVTTMPHSQNTLGEKRCLAPMVKNASTMTRANSNSSPGLPAFFLRFANGRALTRSAMAHRR